MKRLLDQYGKPMPTAREREANCRLSAKYDSAQTTTENSRHWANADGLAANAAANPAARAKIRNRARYECFESNCYGLGIVLTAAQELIGTGPRLQLQTVNAQANRFVEKLWSEWSRCTRLAAKLVTMTLAKLVEGEGLAVKITNRGLAHPVKLDLRLRESDRLATPDLAGPTESEIDGIRFDQYGNPAYYTILKRHPGADLATPGDPLDYDEVPAANVIHWFRQTRAEQDRGVSEVAPALPLFAQLRRFTLATVAAAETAAEHSGVISTNSSAVDPDDVEPMDAIEMEMRQFLTMPRGWSLNQLKAEHPTTTYPMFKRELLSEIARCICMAYNVAAADSSTHNYASGRLDKQAWQIAIRTIRRHCEQIVLESLLGDFLVEAALEGMLPNTPVVQASNSLPPIPKLQGAAGYLHVMDFSGEFSQVVDWLKGGAEEAPGLCDVIRATQLLKAAGYGDEAALVLQTPHCWMWDGQGHTDPQKEANGQKIRIGNATSSRRQETLDMSGRDIDELDAENARDYGFGDDVDAYRRAVFANHFPATANPEADSEPQVPEESQDEVEAISSAWEYVDEDIKDEIRELLEV